MKGDLDGIVRRIRIAKEILETAKFLADGAGDKDGAQRIGKSVEEVEHTEKHFEGIQSDMPPKK